MARSAYLRWLASALGETAPVPPAGGRADADMVLGYATGYGPAELEPFVRSLRAAFAGPAALVVDERKDVRAFLEAHDVEAMTASPAGAWRPHPVVARFSAYAAILEARPDVRSVIITDVRDVIFQGDPFREPADGLEFFIENEDAVLAGHAFNMKHLRALAGEALTDRIKGGACICVGVVAGPRVSVIQFCRLLLMLCAIPRSPVGGAFGADQAACNLIAHLGLMPSRLQGNYGRVATIGLTPADRLLIRDGRILNPDGGWSPVVHQYDRVGRLADHVADRWGRGSTGRPPDRRPTATARLQASVRRRLPEWR